MTFANPKICSCKPLTKTVNLSAWELDCLGWMLVDCGLGMWGDAVSVCPRAVWAAEPWPEWVICGIDSLFGVLNRFCFSHSTEEWLLLIWKDNMDIGHWQTRIVPSLGGWTPLSTTIFMMRLQKGRHVHAAVCAAVFPIVWKMWAQISIKTPVMKSHKNCALPRLMNPMLDSGSRLENIINVSVFNSGSNFAVPMDVPLAETSWSTPWFAKYLPLEEVCHHMEKFPHLVDWFERPLQGNLEWW